MRRILRETHWHSQKQGTWFYLEGQEVIVRTQMCCMFTCCVSLCQVSYVEGTALVIGFEDPMVRTDDTTGQALSTDQMALHRAPVDHRKVALPQLTLISHLSPTSLWLQSPLTSGTLIELLTLSALHLEGQHEA